MNLQDVHKTAVGAWLAGQPGPSHGPHKITIKLQNHITAGQRKQMQPLNDGVSKFLEPMWLHLCRSGWTAIQHFVALTLCANFNLSGSCFVGWVDEVD